MKKVVISLLGHTLDKGKDDSRWRRWRPNISLFQNKDFKIDRLELLNEKKGNPLRDIIVKDINSISPDSEICLHDFPINDPWNFEEVYSTLLDFSQNYNFNLDKEEYFLHISTGSHVAQICFFLLTESRHFPAKLLQTSPGEQKVNGFTSPTYQIIDLDLSKYDLIANRFHKEFKDGLHFLKAGIETKNQNFNKLIEKIELVASKSTDPLLLMGPTGAGKSELAKRISILKKDKKQVTGKFVEVNCATLRGDIAMSTLFGHTKGAYTGALNQRTGLITLANGGILFLDEIAELGLDEQAMLLRAIEEKRFFPMGSDKEIKSDFQLIAGTNKDLYKEVRAGRFREDLLARINIWTFYLPGLKERQEDISPNIDYELNKYTKKYGTRISFSKEAKDCFLKISMEPKSLWCGNFRDLNTVITRMGTLCDKGRISTELVISEMSFLQDSWEKIRNEVKSETKIDLHNFLSEEVIEGLDLFDRIQLESVLLQCKSAKNISAAGRELFSKSRKKRRSINDSDRLRKYLGKYGLLIEDIFS